LEEWDVTQFDTDVSTTRQTIGYDSSRFRFHLHAERKTEYYQIRILVPIGIIVFISWIILFLKDYKIRIDIASGNLLLFIAFNFVISKDLPRLSYLTFMDAVLFTAFAITSFSVIINVILRRMEASGRVGLAQRIDRVLIWAYPFVYALGVLVAYRRFFRMNRATGRYACSCAATAPVGTEASATPEHTGHAQEGPLIK
jgi:hypothetical protein